MPQGKNSQKSSHSNKKKGGRAPAHQNKFAFKHNPKSKLTDKILSSPNVGVCRRCHDKIEWRKKYRKYKPRTQPGKCNLCKNRNVLAAYHTICPGCAVSDRAHAAAKAAAEGEADIAAGGDALQADGEVSDQDSVDDFTEGSGTKTPSVESSDVETKNPTTVANSSSVRKKQPRPRRICAICVCEPALGGSSDVVNDEIAALQEKLSSDTARPLKLRERRAMERKLQRLREEEASKRKAERQSDAAGFDDTGEEERQGGEHDGKNEEVVESDIGDTNGGEEGEEDPFLKAVGGADRLLTGEAYQKLLLERENQAKPGATR